MKSIFVLAVVLCLFSTSAYSQSEETDFKRADELIDMQMYQEAIQILEDLVKFNPQNSDYFRSLGFSYLNLFDYDSAIKNFVKATELEPDCIKCFSHLARAHFEKGEFDTAEGIIKKAFLLSDTTAHVYMTRGLIYQQTNRTEKALLDFTKAISLDPKDETYFILRANFYLYNNEPYAAYSDISDAIKLDPNNGEYYYYRAFVLNNAGLADEALIDMNKALSLSNNVADFYNLLYSIYYSLGDFEKGEQALLKSLEIKPDDHNTYFYLSEAYFMMNDFDRFCDYQTKALELTPVEFEERIYYINRNFSKYCIKENMPYYFVRALGAYNDKNFGECISVLEKGLIASEQSSALYNLKASAHLAKKEYQKAYDSFMSSVETEHKLKDEVNNFHSAALTDSDAILVAESYVVKNFAGLATYNLITGNYDKALLQINRAIDKSDAITGFDGAEFLYNTKGLIYIAKNDFISAEECFSRASEINPFNLALSANKALITVLQNIKYNPKKLRFDYWEYNHAPRMIIPAGKVLADANKDDIENAIIICNSIIEIEPENAYAFLIKAKLLQISNDTEYCSAANEAKNFGFFDAYKELGIKCGK